MAGRKSRGRVTHGLVVQVGDVRWRFYRDSSRRMQYEVVAPRKAKLRKKIPR